MAEQRAFHLRQFNAVATDLDLEIFAAEELDQAVVQVTPQVAGAVQALAAARMVDKALGGFLGIPR